MTEHTTFKIRPNGYLPLSLGWQGAFYSFQIVGGPYDAFPGRHRDLFGVCVRAERVKPGSCDVHLPIRDFDVPLDDAHVEMAIRDTFRAAIRGRKVYVGCMGGWGRTGLFLALLAKAAGVADPVAYVREHYSRNAVETPAQEAYVRTFDVTKLRGWLKKYAWAHRFPLLARLIGWDGGVI